LPRFVSIILNEPINRINDALDFLSRRFPKINYAPLYELCEKSENIDTLQKYLENWRVFESDKIIECWLCFELTLANLVDNFPAKSKK